MGNKTKITYPNVGQRLWVCVCAGYECVFDSMFGLQLNVIFLKQRGQSSLFIIFVNNTFAIVQDSSFVQDSWGVCSWRHETEIYTAHGFHCVKTFNTRRKKT